MAERLPSSHFDRAPGGFGRLSGRLSKLLTGFSAMLYSSKRIEGFLCAVPENSFAFAALFPRGIRRTKAGPGLAVSKGLRAKAPR